MTPQITDPPDAGALCTRCGLCCAGLFGRIRLRPEDLPLAGHAGTPIIERSGNRYAQLPCTFLAGTICTVYAARYTGCRSFACALLRRYLDGKVGQAAATERIAEMQRLLAILQAPVDPVDGRAAARARLHRVAFDLYADRHFRNAPRSDAPAER